MIFINFWFNSLENIEVSEFSKNYKDLKNQISDKDSKVIPYLIFGIVIGRIFEKIVRAKKKLFKKRK